MRIRLRLRFDGNDETKDSGGPPTEVPSLAPSRFRAAMILAIAADALQILVFPFFAEGAVSPADDLLDIALAAVLVHLLG
jgi:hypothetical protein